MFRLIPVTGDCDKASVRLLLDAPCEEVAATQTKFRVDLLNLNFDVYMSYFLLVGSRGF